ncbi:MAG: Ig-like domain-containing protein [Pseudonocardiaceae bacterium]
MAMPRRTPWHRLLAALVALLGLVLGTQDLLAPGAEAVPQPPPCGLTAALTQCATGTGSTSAMVTAPAGARATTTAFMVTPSGPVIQGTPVILVAQVSPANAIGTIQFNDGDTELGMPRPVIGGFALTVTSKLAKGTHSLTAVFTAADQAAFGPSMPPPVSLTVIGPS